MLLSCDCLWLAVDPYQILPYTFRFKGSFCRQSSVCGSQRLVGLSTTSKINMRAVTIRHNQKRRFAPPKVKNILAAPNRRLGTGLRPYAADSVKHTEYRLQWPRAGPATANPTLCYSEIDSTRAACTLDPCAESPVLLGSYRMPRLATAKVDVQ